MNLDRTTEQPRAAVHTLGCRLNQAESAAIRASLEAAGYRIVPWGEAAEVCLLNSCTVTAQADAKARQALRGARRRNPGATLGLLGCYAQTQGPRLAGQGLADLIVGNAEKMNVAALLPRATMRDTSAGGAPVVVRPRIGRAPFTLDAFAATDGRTRAALKIQDGCDFMCTFCIIPAARGRARPRALDNLLAEGRALGEAGVREIVLTGVNLGTYDEGGAGLCEVVDRLAAAAPRARLRISSIEPTTVEPGLLERMAAPDHPLTPFLHLPLQSGAEGVLRAMRRRYTAAAYRRFAEEALAQVPGLWLGTDVLVGFPGEDATAFGETHALLEALPFASFHVFPYSEREGTPSLRLPGKVPEAEKARRVALLRELSDRKQRAFQTRNLGETRDVLFQRGRAPGVAPGLTDNYLRVEVAVPRSEALHNQVLPVRLEAVAGKAVRGVVAT